MQRKSYCLVFSGLFVIMALLPVVAVPSLHIDRITSLSPAVLTADNISLPTPLNLAVSLEESMARRMSIREFTAEEITLEELSTVLWAAYGVNPDYRHTVHHIDGIPAVQIYVLRQDAIYSYNPLAHTLEFYREGDFRSNVAQYDAPIQLGLTWDTTATDDANFSAAEIGAVGQNVQFAANALELGTVVTGEAPSPLDGIGLPAEHVGRIVMPLGHPIYPYDFVNRPQWISLLPRITPSSLSLSDALADRQESTSWSDGDISRQDLSHLVWSSYGYSYYLDVSEQEANPVKRHRTVPSAHGYYPFDIYAVTADGTYRYFGNIVPIDLWGLPIITFLWPVCGDDNRETIAAASAAYVGNAPLIIIPVLSIEKTVSWDDLSASYVRWVWSYEAGAAAFNVLLEATARGMAGNITPVIDKDAICELLHLDPQEYDPLVVVPVGYP
jgi:nitroreductase